jgi:hypothetical protein
MKVPQNIVKCVGFLAFHNHSLNKLQLVGTAFFLGKDKGETAETVYLVTARHVIQGLNDKGVDQVFLIVNMEDGYQNPRTQLALPMKDWFFHPDDNSIDVAIFKTNLPYKADHLIFPLSLCVSEKILSEQEVGLGDSVFVTGLFSHHFGKQRNIPIVRTGNLAALDDEKVATKKFGEIDAYLIEARSIGGLSGSPVLLNLGHTRSIGGKIKQWQSSDPAFYLLGLIHGHYDDSADELDADDKVDSSALTNEKINTGIAIVVPYYNILAVIDKFENR